MAGIEVTPRLPARAAARRRSTTGLELRPPAPPSLTLPRKLRGGGNGRHPGLPEAAGARGWPRWENSRILAGARSNSPPLPRQRGRGPRRVQFNASRRARTLAAPYRACPSPGLTVRDRILPSPRGTSGEGPGEGPPAGRSALSETLPHFRTLALPHSRTPALPHSPPLTRSHTPSPAPAPASSIRRSARGWRPRRGIRRGGRGRGRGESGG